MEKGFLIVLFLGCLILPASPAGANILFLIFGGGIIIEAGIRKTFPPKKDWLKLLVLPSFFFLWMLIGMIFSSYKKEALNLVEIAIPYMLLSLAYISASSSLKERALKVIPSGLISGVVVSLLYLLVLTVIRFYKVEDDSFLTIFSHEFTYYKFIEPISTHPTYYAVWILIANYFVFTSKILKTPIKMILLTLFFIGLFFTMSRVALFLYALQIFAIFFYLSKKGKIIYGVGVLGFLLIGIYLYNYQLRNFYVLQRLSIELAWDTNPDNTESEINNRVADDSRIARWSAIWESIKEKPVLGYGVGSERAVLDKAYKDHGLEISVDRKYNSHNQYLFYLVEQGMVGLFLVLSFFGTNIAMAFKRRDFFLISFILGIMMVFVFENYMYRSMGYLTIAMLLTFMRKSGK